MANDTPVDLVQIQAIGTAIRVETTTPVRMPIGNGQPK
jgi:hypothetical protein